jgi:hypothetical protein
VGADPQGPRVPGAILPGARPGKVTDFFLLPSPQGAKGGSVSPSGHPATFRAGGSAVGAVDIVLWTVARRAVILLLVEHPPASFVGPLLVGLRPNPSILRACRRTNR